MGDAQMELGEREFKKIGEYVKSHLKEWIAESGANLGAGAAKDAGEESSAGGETGEQKPVEPKAAVEAFAIRRRELDLIERVVRIEDELKNLREVMEERFGRIDERFSKMDERFEAQRELMNERFETQRELMDERFQAQRELMDERFQTQRELMDERFGRMDERFSKMDERFEAQRELMNERFDHMEKRTSFSQWIIGIGFTAVGVLMLVLNYFG